MRLVGETPASILGRVVCVDESSGRIFLLDGQLGTVQALDAEGLRSETILRPGEGPGELDFVSWLALANEKVVVSSYSPRKIKILDPVRTGDYQLMSLVPDQKVRTTAFMEAANLLVVQQASVQWAGESVTRKFRFAAYRMDGVQDTDTLFTDFVFGGPVATISSSRLGQGVWKWTESVSRQMTDVPPRWAVGADRLFVANRFDSYHVDVYGSDGTRKRSIERPEYKSVPKRDEEKDWFSEQYEGHEIQLADDHPDIVGLYARPGGYLWVLPSDGCNNRDYDRLEFDVFDATGDYKHRLVVNLDLALDRSLPLSTYRDAIVVTDEAVFIITEYSAKYAGELENDPQEPVVIRLALPATVLPAECPE